MLYLYLFIMLRCLCQYTMTSFVYVNRWYKPVVGRDPGYWAL